MRDGDALDERASTYAAEDAHEHVMPGRTLDVDEARAWLAAVAHVEDLDPPSLVARHGNGRAEACVVRDLGVIVTYSSRPSAHALLHEMAHLACTNPYHGREFRARLVGLVRRHMSLPHAVHLHAQFVARDLAVDPFEASAN